MMRANLEIRPLTPVIGAEVLGVDLAQGLDEVTFRDLHRALLDHHVVILPEQRIGPAEQLAFARRFGEIEPPHPVFDVVDEQPEVTVIEQDGSPAGLYNDMWHTDVTFRARPAMASILHAQVLPPAGGDTGWVSLIAAYESLSEPVKELIEGKSAIHDYYMAFADTVLDGRGGLEKLVEDLRAYPPVEHPVVRTHPETGKKGLFVNRSFTKRLVGFSPVESDYLLRMLCEHAEHPNHQMRWRWSPADLVIWDNRCTMHLATSNFNARRRMHRVTILGDRPCL